jgi:hypothetical protein
MTVVLFLPLKLITCFAPGFFVCIVYESAGTYLPMNKDMLHIKNYVPIVFLLKEISVYEDRKKTKLHGLSPRVNYTEQLPHMKIERYH